MIDMGILKREILKLAEKEDRLKENEYHITELIYCQRKAYLHRKYQVPYIANGKMLAGILFHEKLSTILPSLMQGEILLNVPCEKNYGTYKIVGEADAVNKNIVYEFKYTGASLSSKLPLNYCLQANAYALLLNKPKFCIVYVNSFTLEPTAYESNTDISLFKIIEQSAEQLHQSLQADSIPNGPCYDWECQSCKVMHLCRR